MGKGKRKDYTEDQIVEALNRAAGNPYTAAVYLGCSSTTLYERLRDSDTLKAARVEAQKRYDAELLDACEHGIKKIASELEEDRALALKSIQYVLSKKGKDRGWDEKTEHLIYVKGLDDIIQREEGYEVACQEEVE